MTVSHDLRKMNNDRRAETPTAPDAPLNSNGQDGPHSPAPAPVVPMQLTAAYSVCRSISRKNARNFYYGFLVLPREKRDALCAVYAFMRHADDISDDPGLSPSERRARLTAWLEEFRRVIGGGATDDPVLLALADTQYRYAIPPALLEALVEGTAMDLQPDQSTEPQDPSVPHPHPERSEGEGWELYSTFDDLYRYCYHVASVVGLVCIRIFGYRDPAAEALAERVGVAFQLTNIIRDVKEDAAMGRVYLPLEDLQKFNLLYTKLLALREDTASSEPARSSLAVAEFRPLLEFEAQRAREFYAAAAPLIPLIDDDSRPALWTLVTIYRRLLEKIAARGYDVFRERVRLTTAEKLSILAKGFWRRIA